MDAIPPRRLGLKLVLAGILLVVLLGMGGGGGSEERRRPRDFNEATDSMLLVIRALANHPPSWRIFRALLQINLMLWCAALSLLVWSRTFSLQTLGDLLFYPVDDDSDGHDALRGGAKVSALFSRTLYERVHDRSETTGDRRIVGQRHVPAARNTNSDDDDDNGVITGERTGDIAQKDDRLKSDTAHAEEEDLVNVTIGSEKEILLDLEAVGVHDGREDDGQNDDDDYEEDEPTTEIPTASHLANAALDMLWQILVTLLLFTWTSAGYLSTNDAPSAINASSAAPVSETYYSVTQVLSHVAAPTFPLLLFVYYAVVAVTPWKDHRSHLWKLVIRTAMAPLHPVTFRDGFLGDVLTSSVRPLQDVAFTAFYLAGGLQGWWSWSWTTSANLSSHPSNGTRGSTFVDRADALVPRMEKSWLYYTVVLPMCLVSPLWWRYLQNLRQSYDGKRRWPFLGNAAKYFCAAQVAVVGIFFPSQRRTAWWLCAFALATLYQVWWDIFMDWNLIERRNQRWQLRQRRAYKSSAFYWITCCVNIALRFCWTLTFLPPRYLDTTGTLRQSLGNDLYVNFVMTPVIASAEIIRRTLWGWIRLEWEAVKNQIQDEEDSSVLRQGLDQSSLELTPMKLGRTEHQSEAALSTGRFALWPTSRLATLGEDMIELTEGQILGELGVWATCFALLGAVAAANRETQ